MMPPDDETTPPPPPQDEADAALRDALPSWMKDGQGLRGPNPRVGRDPGADGASGNLGDMQINDGRPGDRRPDDPKQNDQPATNQKLFEGLIILDPDDETFYMINVWTDGTKTPL